MKCVATASTNAVRGTHEKENAAKDNDLSENSTR